MRGRDEEVVRHPRGALRVRAVEGIDADAEAARVAADVVEGEQACVAVEGGVLHALGHHGRRGLLEARHERLGRAVEEALQAGLAQHLEILRVRPPAADVGPVDGERDERGLEVRRRIQPPQPLDVGRERPLDLLALGLRGPVAERARVARQLLPQRSERRLAGGIDEQRGDVDEELVADRPLHRPRPQLLAGVENLLHPHVPRAAVAQALEVAGGIGQPVRMVDPQPVDQALRDERERQAMRLREHLRVLLADAGEVVDVEEAPVPPRVRVEVEERPPALRIRPVGVRVVRGHVVRDDVQDDAQPGLVRGRGERTEPRLAAERVRDARRVHDVVAVLRPLARLERRRQVEVRDAQVAEVRHEVADAREREVGPQLEPVGGAEWGRCSGWATTPPGAGASASAPARSARRATGASRHRRAGRARRCSARRSTPRRSGGWGS